MWKKFEEFTTAAWQVMKDRASADLSEALDDKAQQFEIELAAAADAKDKTIAARQAEVKVKDDLLRARADIRAERSANLGLAAQNCHLEEEIARLRARLGELPGGEDGAKA